MAKKDPKLVNDFYNATIRGWKWAFENIPESVDIIYNKYNPQNKSIDALLFEAHEMKKLVYDAHGNIGTISKDKIDLIANTYKIMGLMKNDIDFDEFVLNRNRETINLSKDELDYLKNKKYITYCSHNDLMPFESTKDGKHIGILEDYIQEMSYSLNIDFKFIPTNSWQDSFKQTTNNECDILTTIASKEKREHLLNFTKPTVDFPFVIATDITKPFIESIDKLAGKKIALVKDFATSKIIKDKYKYIDFIEYPTLHNALDAVKTGEVYAVIDSLAVISYEIQNHFLGEIKVSGKIDEQLKLFMATYIDNKILASILDKALASIEENQKVKIFNKWISINFKDTIDYKFLIKLSALLLIILVILAIAYRAYLLKKINQTLEKKVDFEVKQNEEKNRILMQQSKMAAMGEMLENIAHQWRQPLSTISVCVSGMELKKTLNCLEDKEFYDSINHIKTSISYLTNTIEDFRSFLDQNKFISNISSNDILKKVIDILTPSFNSHKIEVIKNIDEFNFSSLENELIQVLMNIFTNSKDALKELNTEEKYIFVNIKQNDINIEIEIYDNALGIDERIIDRVFEPYFTTKHKSQGTGIGLYMSKLLVDTHLKGEISVKNKKFIYNNIEYFGASFKILLPKRI